MPTSLLKLRKTQTHRSSQNSTWENHADLFEDIIIDNGQALGRSMSIQTSSVVPWKLMHPSWATIWIYLSTAHAYHHHSHGSYTCSLILWHEFCLTHISGTANGRFRSSSLFLWSWVIYGLICFSRTGSGFSPRIQKDSTFVVLQSKLFGFGRVTTIF